MQLSLSNENNETTRVQWHWPPIANNRALWFTSEEESILTTKGIERPTVAVIRLIDLGAAHNSVS